MSARATQTATANARAKKATANATANARAKKATATTNATANASASSKRRSAAARPPAASAPLDRRTYEPRLETATLADLPFTQGGEFGEPLQAWAPAKVKTYGEACLLGAEYAAHWLQFVKDGGGKHYVYTLGGIVQAMDFEDASAAKGVIVGFFAHIERVVRGAVQCFDVYEDLDLATAYLRPQREPETRGAKRGRIT